MSVNQVFDTADERPVAREILQSDRFEDVARARATVIRSTRFVPPDQYEIEYRVPQIPVAA